MRKCSNSDLHLSPSSPLMGDCTTNIANKQDNIFKNGRICVFDLTELQARAIIWKASEEIMKQRVERGLYALPAGSLKRSLQRFFQKRKKRLQSSSPYNPA